MTAFDLLQGHSYGLIQQFHKAQKFRGAISLDLSAEIRSLALCGTLSSGRY